MAYWFGGSGNFSDASHWSNNSGNSPASLLGRAPNASDDAIFDANSYNDDYTITIDAPSTCKDFIMDKPTGAGKKVTWAGTGELAISGSLALTGGTAGITRTYSGTITFNATSGIKTLSTNSIILPWIVFDGIGGTFKLLTDLYEYANISLRNGTFDPNGLTVIQGNVGLGTNSTIEGNFTFYNLDIVGIANKTPSRDITTGFTVTNLLSINGNSTINRLLFKSSVIGTPRTITAANISISNCDFQDITCAGLAGNIPWTGTSIGDCGGNTNLTPDSPVTTNWESGTTWSTATWSSRVPLPQDTATFTTAGTATITQDMPRIGSVDFTGSSDKTWTTSTACSCFGSINLTDLATLTASTQTYTFAGRGNYTITSAGKTWDKGIQLNAVGGKLTFTDNFVSNNFLGTLNGTYDASTYNVNITCSKLISVGNGNIIIDMGNGTWELIGPFTSTTYDAWAPFRNVTGTRTINCGNSTIKITDSTNTIANIQGTDKTYNNVWFSRGTSTGTNTISGSNTFNQLKDDTDNADTILFTAGTTQTIADWQISGTAGKVKTINSTTTGTFNLVITGTANASADYLNIQHCIATPFNRWFAGNNSVNNQGVATAGRGWRFMAPPGVSAQYLKGRSRNRQLFNPISIA